MTHENSPSMSTFEQGLPDKLPEPEKRIRRFRQVIYVLCAIALLLSVFNLWSSSKAGGGAGTGSISGYLIDEWGRPVEAEIMIVGYDLAAETDETGYFEMSGVPEGDRTIVVTYLLTGVEHSAGVGAGEATDLGVVSLETRLREDYPVARVDWR